MRRSLGLALLAALVLPMAALGAPAAYVRLVSVSSLADSWALYLNETLLVGGVRPLQYSAFYEVPCGLATVRVNNATLPTPVLLSESTSSTFVVYANLKRNTSDVAVTLSAETAVGEYAIGVNQAVARVLNTMTPGSAPVTVSIQSSNCYQCLFRLPPLAAAIRPLDPPTNYTTIEADHGQRLQVSSSATGQQLFLDVYPFGEMSSNTIVVYGSVDAPGILVIPDIDGLPRYTPLFVAFGVLAGLIMAFMLSRVIYESCTNARKIKLHTAPEYERLINDSWDATVQENAHLTVTGGSTASLNASGGGGNDGSGSVNATHNSRHSIISTGAAPILSPAEELAKDTAVRLHARAAKPDPHRPRQGRLRSLDSFRGFALFIMIFVNYGGGGYWFFDHSVWNGLTVADLVFPWFIFMMGVSMALSFKRLLRNRPPLSSFFYRIVRRSLILVGLGLFLNNGYDIANWRIPGVLQRFGISFFCVACVVYLIPEHDDLVRKSNPFRDIVIFWRQWVVILSLAVVWLIATFVPHIDGCPKGYIGPGGVYGTYGTAVECTGGTAGWLDRKVFGERHIYQDPTCKFTYGTGAYDPEGLLGCLTSIVITYFGYHVGRVLVSYETHAMRLKRLVTVGLIWALLGTALCGGAQNTGVIPLNKNLWSLSFVLCMAGTGTLMLSIAYVLIDVKKWWNGAPFIYPGMNSIAVYCGSELLQPYFPFSYLTPNTYAHQLPMSIIGAVSWLIVAYYWFSIDFFVKI